MLKKIRMEVADALTRQKIYEAVRNYSRRYYTNGIVYDLGGVPRYSYRKYFSGYKTVNFDNKEDPDVLASAEKLPFKHNSIRNMLCIAMLEHTREPEKVVKEMHRVMKRGGSALVWVPFYWREHNYPIDNFRYTKQGIEELLKKHGFRIVESRTEPYDGLFFMLSHNVRFMIKDPHNVKWYNPLLYLHALLYRLSKLDSVLELRHPGIYTGIEIVILK